VRQTDLVKARLGSLRERIEQTQGVHHAGVDAETDRRVTALHAVQCRPTRERPLGHDGHRQAAPHTSRPEILPELA